MFFCGKTIEFLDLRCSMMPKPMLVRVFVEDRYEEPCRTARTNLRVVVYCPHTDPEERIQFYMEYMRQMNEERVRRGG